MNNNIQEKVESSIDELVIDSSFIAPSETFQKIARTLSNNYTEYENINDKIIKLQVKYDNLQEKYNSLEKKINCNTFYALCANISIGVVMIASGVILFVSKKAK
jgi:chromosome segregation ATPase